MDWTGLLGGLAAIVTATIPVWRALSHRAEQRRLAFKEKDDEIYRLNKRMVDLQDLRLKERDAWIRELREKNLLIEQELKRSEELRQTVTKRLRNSEPPSTGT